MDNWPVGVMNRTGPAIASRLAAGVIAGWVTAAIWAASPDKLPGAEDWMIPECQRPISQAFPERPASCAGGGSAVGATQAPAVTAPAVATPAAIQPIAVGNADSKVVKLTRFRTSIRDDERVGEAKVGIFCNTSVPITMGQRSQPLVLGAALRPLSDEFTSAGYKDPSRSRGLFDDDSDLSRVDFQLGAMLEDFKTSYCVSGISRVNGQVTLSVRWELFDPVARKVLISMVTRGSYQTQGTESISESEFIGRAYRGAIRSLLANQQFYDLVVEAPGTVPAARQQAVSSPQTGAERLALKRVRPYPGSLLEQMTSLRAAVVTVGTGAGGTGSGFFVGEDGYVMTNSHVVGGHRFVRVKLATGRELVGEVIKRDTGRDVALIKTEGSRYMPLAINAADVNIGSEVTAIGSPGGDALSGTVTRGIVSAYRSIDGRRYIQSDVAILPGNSGGPLLEANGSVIGITVMGLRTGGMGRVNFFAPIRDALESLELTVAD